MIPGRSVSSAKLSGEHLKESHTGAGSSTVTAKIFPAILKVRSMPQVTCSVAWGNERHRSRTQSTSRFIGRSVGEFGFVVEIFERSVRLVDADVFVPNGRICADEGSQ